MADMRLIVAGAGGRMGRALVRVISDTPGAVLTGALEAPGSELLGKDSGVLAPVGQCRRHHRLHRAGCDHR
jgi:4-hydroxy-tetrahydrodipicolinate reductase